jgi:hypothetical protein
VATSQKTFVRMGVIRLCRQARTPQKHNMMIFNRSRRSQARLILSWDFDKADRTRNNSNEAFGRLLHDLLVRPFHPIHLGAVPRSRRRHLGIPTPAAENGLRLIRSGKVGLDGITTGKASG